jgi:hypothetical protein
VVQIPEAGKVTVTRTAEWLHFPTSYGSEETSMAFRVGSLILSSRRMGNDLFTYGQEAVIVFVLFSRRGSDDSL